ncbi:MAG: H-NS histone family protein [Ramlibacter sp.]|nr:H-NS histone family protein [Ramlibacter sp.]
MAQIEALKREAEKARAVELQAVIERIKEAIRFYDLTAEDLGLAPARKRASSRAKPPSNNTRAPKFSDAAGNVWSGRGPRPRWLKDALKKGAKLEQFAISSL